MPGLYASFWHGLWAPKGTPIGYHRATKFRGAVGLGRPQGTAALYRPGPSDSATRPADFGALGKLQKAAIEKWWPIIKAAGIKAG